MRLAIHIFFDALASLVITTSSSLCLYSSGASNADYSYFPKIDWALPTVTVAIRNTAKRIFFIIC
ncbi:hypothetical protein PG614_05065 [Riemerella anatipestifer]|nr:hypothetical protein [Riemerella anatipestifer]MDY3533222.1 hypothetical protein [Riemerella anatipestifer]MDY3535312.1 hypothetical protein [Riemerella anatipestifer]